MSEVAGQLQGRLPGDLGELGDGSLTLSWMEDTVEMLITRYSDVSDETGLVQSSLGDKHEKHLELIARLLYSAQRLYLCRAELETDALSSILTRVIGKNLTDPDNFRPNTQLTEELPRTAPDVIVQSPFWKTVLVPLLIAANVSPSTLLENARPSSHYAGLLASLEMAVSSGRKDTPRTLTRHLLQIVSVCASLFPVGACWVTNSHTSWYAMPFSEGEENRLDANMIVPPRYIPGCAPEDLAIVLNTLYGILKVYGELDGDANIQFWVTRALGKLTRSTSSLALLNRESSMEEAQAFWRKVWSVIFRRDLRYCSSTADCSPNSFGEAVSCLIAAFAENMCADLDAQWSNDVQSRHSSFLRQRQDDVWNLPLFTEPLLHNCAAASRLTCSLVTSVGLSEGKDSIGRNTKEGPSRSLESRDRRSRLTNFFLFFLETACRNRSELNQLCSCLSRLAYGSCEESVSTKNSPSSISEDIEMDGSNDFGEWKDLPLVNAGSFFPIPTTTALQVFDNCVSSKRITIPSADLVSQSIQVVLGDHIWSFLQSIVSRTELDEIGLERLSYYIETESALLKVFPSEAVKLRYNDFCRNVALLLQSVRKAVFSLPPSSECIKSLAKVLKNFMMLGALFDLPLPDGVTSEGVELYQELTHILVDYPAHTRTESKSPADSKVGFSSDEESDNEHSWSRKRPAPALGSPAKRKRNSSAILSSLQPIDVFCMADIVLALRPTLKSLKIVIEGLTGAEVDRLWSLQSREIDPAAAIYVMWLMVHHTIRYDEGEKESAIDILLEVSKALKQADTVPVDCTVFCQASCLQMVRRKLSRDALRHLTSDESSGLLSLWIDIDGLERKFQSLRPNFRSESIRLASELFLQGGNELRSTWGRAFPVLVLAGLRDRSSLVRRQSSISIARCITSTGNEAAVVDSTLQSLYKGEGRQSFEEWYRSFVPKLDVITEQMWQDLYQSASATSYFSMALVGGETSSAIDQTRVYFSLVDLASRWPLREGLCFLLLETMASLSGYDSIEAMTCEFCNEILTIWFSKERESAKIDDLPMILSSPGICRFAVRAGLHTKFSDSQVDHLRAEAAADFAARSQWLFPVILSTASSPLNEDERVRDFLSLYGDEVGDESSFAKLVKQSLSGVFSLAITLKWGSDSDKESAIRLHKMLEATFSKEKLEAATRRSALGVVYRLLAGFWSPLYKERIDISDLKNTILRFSTNFGETDKKDPFFVLGGSCLELLLFASGIVVRNQKSCRAGCSLKPLLVIMEVITDCIRSGDMQNPPLGFCLVLVSDLLARDMDAKVHEEIVHSTMKMLHNISSLSGDPQSSVPSPLHDITQDLEILLVASIALHERTLAEFVASLRSSFALLRRYALLSMGLDSHVNEDGTISNTAVSSNFFASEAAYFVRLITTRETDSSSTTLELIESIYDFVKWFSVNEKATGIQFDNFLPGADATGQINPRDTSVLEKINAKLVLRTVVASEGGLQRRKGPSDILQDIQRLVASSMSALPDTDRKENVSPVARLLHTHLSHLSTSLAKDALVGEEVATSFALLANLCRTLPKRFVNDSMVCIGKLRKSIEGSSSKSLLRTKKNPFEADSSVAYARLSIEAKCVDVLAGCLRGGDLEKSMLACETLGVMLKRRKASEFSQFLEGWVIALLAPFFSRQGHQNSKRLTIDPSSDASLKTMFGAETTWENWCWNEEHWKKAVRVRFESWVCLIVPAILLCRRGERNASRQTQDWLDCFQSMARSDALFASTLFPLCILDCLVGSSPTPDNDSVRNDTWIGSPDSKSNQLVSRCFTSVLYAYVENDTVDPRAAALVLDTLDFLRNLTHSRFLQSDNHSPNDRQKKQNHDTSSQGSQNQEIPNPNRRPTSTGVLYGTVVRVDGLLIARACMKAGRYSSARFYAECFADSRFGGTTKILHILAEGFLTPLGSSGDISGFGQFGTNGESNENPPSENLVDDVYKVLHLLREASLVDGSQQAETVALESLISDLSLSFNGLKYEQGYRVSAISPIDEIRCLSYEPPSSAQTTSIVDCLANLGIPCLVQSFILGKNMLDGLESMPDKISSKLYESCLEDPRLFDVGRSTGKEYSIGYDEVSRQFASDVSSFHEVFLSTLSSYVKDDFRTCSVRVAASRAKVIDDLTIFQSGESTWRGVHQIIDRAAALNDIDSLIRVGSKRSDIIKSWIVEDALSGDSLTVHGSTVSPIFPVSDFAQEVAARDALRRANVGPVDRRPVIVDTLSRLLWQMVDRNRANGNMEKCEALLARLRAPELLTVTDAMKTIRRSMLDADIHEARGDALFGIRSMRQTVHWLQRNEETSNHKEAVAKGLLELAARMAETKAETGEVILREYFDPGLLMAKEQNDRENSLESRQVLCSGYLAHADLLVSLYQIVSARVSSPEWAKAERSLQEREAELREMEDLVKTKLGSKKSKKKQAKIKPEDRELAIYRLTVQKEVANARDERLKLMSSVSEFLVRATTSIVEALAIAGSDQHGASKYVYRLISIWFNPKSSAVSTSLEEIFRSAVERIPSYRFVPLANQIFARLGTQGDFATNLQTLARRMCCDHPYHCLPHMVRILGDDPGKDKVQLAKLSVAQKILEEVKGESRGFLLPLIEGYEILCATYIKFASIDADDLDMDRKRRVRITTLPRAARLDECLGKGSRRRSFPPGILSKPPQIRPDGEYKNVEVVLGFEETFSIAPSGLTKPKIIVCFGSNGGKFKQLVKGGDDCRGDSVMEQVFGYVNDLFRSQKILGSEGFVDENKIRTYNIVPLDRKTGVSLHSPDLRLALLDFF